MSKKEGVAISTNSMNNTSIVFPHLAFPQYYHESKNKFSLIRDQGELNRAYNDASIKLSWGGLLLIDKDSEDATLIKNAINKIWIDCNLSTNTRADNPLKDGDVKSLKLEEQNKNGDMYKDKYSIKVSTYKQPDVYDKFGVYSPRSNDAIAGKFCKVLLYLKYYKKGNTVGIKAYLNAIQILDQNEDLIFNRDTSGMFEFATKQPEQPDTEDTTPFGTFEEKSEKPDENNGLPFNL